MKLIALLAWYDEQPGMLRRCIASLERYGVGHLIAVDGAYALYPDGKGSSLPEQQEVIRAAEMPLTLVVPDGVWEEGEVEKRTRLFAEGLKVAEEGDWFLVIDADETIAAMPPNFWGRLEDEEVAYVLVVETFFGGIETSTPYVRLFRAQKIVADTNHWTFRRADGECVAGMYGQVSVPAADMSDFHIGHHHMDRHDERLVQQGDYYITRDSIGIERALCRDCGVRAVILMPANWWERPEGSLAGEMVEVCWDCAEKREKADERWFAAHGHDYSQVPLLRRDGSRQLGKLVVPQPKE